MSSAGEKNASKRVQSQADETSPPLPPTHSYKQARTILLIDDNTAGSQTMSLLLTLEGFTVYAAATGTEAMRLFREIQPAFVLLDIGLPDIDGHSVARSIRTLQSDVRPTIIAITGWGAERDRKLSREAGCDAHLTKPIDFDELASLLNQPSIPLCKIANDDQ